MFFFQIFKFAVTVTYIRLRYCFRNVTPVRDREQCSRFMLYLFYSSCVEEGISAGLMISEIVIRKNCILALIKSMTIHYTINIFMNLFIYFKFKLNTFGSIFKFEFFYMLPSAHVVPILL